MIQSAQLFGHYLAVQMTATQLPQAILMGI